MVAPLLLQAALQSSIDALRPGEHIPGKSSYTASAEFTSAFTSFYTPPSPTQEPQPAIHDPVLNITFPWNLTNPDTIPTKDIDPRFFPPAVGDFSQHEKDELIANVTRRIAAIANDDDLESCAKCKQSLEAIHRVAVHAPKRIPSLAIDLCQSYQLHDNATCEENLQSSTFGSYWAQVLRYADVSGEDGNYICAYLSTDFCPRPAALPLDVDKLFPKPKPKHPKVPKPSGKRTKVLHLSDLHLDPRYFAGSEANCSVSMCCRTNLANDDIPAGEISLDAPLFGYYKCDSPYDLALAALQSVGPLTGTSKEEDRESLGWTIYTGDLVSHDPESQSSQAYVEYAETSVYELFRKYLSGPVFAALGNHDTSPANLDLPIKLPGPMGEEFSWNYDHVAGLWEHEGWIPPSKARQARLHYGGYSVKNHLGLRVITLNTDLWYRSNILNYINTTNPDTSGMLSFLISELQKAEDSGERVWIVGHVLTGWDGTNPLPNPTNLFYQIVDRYSPHVIAGIFFGHIHEDASLIYYTNNGTIKTAETAINTAWIGPSITPLTNLNSGFRLYEVDTGTFEVLDAYTFYADVSSFSSLDGTTTGPVFQLEYSTRDTYGPAAGWPDDAPLSGKFWHRVTEAMERDGKLVETFNGFQGKSSPRSPNCTSDACHQAKICYIRSGSVPLGQECPQGFGSVQSPYTGG